VAAIRPETLLQAARTKRLAPIYLLAGDDTVAIDAALDAIEGTIDEADRAFAVERRYAGEPGGEPIDIVSSARMMPMLGDRRVVIVLRAERLLKPKRAAAADLEVDEDDESRGEGATGAVDASVLEEYLAAPVSSTILVFVAAEVDRSRRLTKRVLEHADVVAFAGLQEAGADPRDQLRTAIHMVEETLAASGRTIDRDAVRALVSRTGGDVTKLRHDVEKLALYAGARLRLTLEDVIEVVSDPNVSEDDWAVVNAIGAGEAGRALIEVSRRLDRGDSAHAIVGQLRWWVSNRLVQSEPARVKAALSALLRTDLALKSSGGDERVLVERLVVELTR
jgi:DNA polymerase-3 subunit delta